MIVVSIVGALPTLALILWCTARAISKLECMMRFLAGAMTAAVLFGTVAVFWQAYEFVLLGCEAGIFLIALIISVESNAYHKDKG